jgi:hypothetical protein
MKRMAANKTMTVAWHFQLWLEAKLRAQPAIEAGK